MYDLCHYSTLFPGYAAGASAQKELNLDLPGLASRTLGVPEHDMFRKILESFLLRFDIVGAVFE